MYKIPLPEIKRKIIQSGKLTWEQLESKIKEKINELAGLISEEGAAHILANEMGIELINSTTGKLKIKEIYAGMKNITAAGKVVHKFQMREFAKGDSKGKVASLIIGDETDTIRVVFWNDQVSILDKIQDNDIILIKDAYVRENKGGKEIHIGERSAVTINPDGEVISAVRQGSDVERRPINELQDGEESEIMGTVVQVFDPRFFTVCSECGKKATELGGTFSCVEHGTVKPSLSYVLNAVLDDGSGTIRGVFWKNQTNRLLGKGEAELVSYKDRPASFENIKTDLLGEQFKLRGKVKKNDMFNRLELNVQLVEKANPEEELARLQNTT